MVKVDGPGHGMDEDWAGEVQQVNPPDPHQQLGTRRSRGQFETAFAVALLTADVPGTAEQKPFSRRVDADQHANRRDDDSDDERLQRIAEERSILNGPGISVPFRFRGWFEGLATADPHGTYRRSEAGSTGRREDAGVHERPFTGS